MTTNFRALCVDLLDWVERASDLHNYEAHDLMAHANAALGVEPRDEEELIDRPQAVSNFSEAHQRMATKIIQFLNEKGGRAKLSEIQNNFENETLESVKTLSVAPGSVVLDLIASNKLYLDSDWEVGIRPTSAEDAN